MSEQAVIADVFPSLGFPAARYYFLQIGDLLGIPKRPQSLCSSVGWHVLDYGNALASSPGIACFGGKRITPVPEPSYYLGVGLGSEVINWPSPEDRHGEETAYERVGTVVEQAWKTAQEMLALAIERRWECLSIIDGDPLMARGLWITATRFFKEEVYDYSPSETDKKVLQRLDKTPDLWRVAPKVPRLMQESST